MGSAVEAPEQLVLLPPQPWCRGPVPLSPPPGEDTSSAGVLLPLPHTHRSILSAGTRGTEHSPSTPAQGGDTPGWRGPRASPGGGQAAAGGPARGSGVQSTLSRRCLSAAAGLFITFFFLIIFFFCLPAGAAHPVPSRPCPVPLAGGCRAPRPAAERAGPAGAPWAAPAAPCAAAPSEPR